MKFHFHGLHLHISDFEPKLYHGQSITVALSLHLERFAVPILQWENLVPILHQWLYCFEDFYWLMKKLFKYHYPGWSEWALFWLDICIMSCCFAFYYEILSSKLSLPSLHYDKLPCLHQLWCSLVNRSRCCLVLTMMVSVDTFSCGLIFYLIFSEDEFSY